MAKLYFKYGAMGSSKSAQALIAAFNYEELGMSIWLIKPSVDDRDGADIIRSRIGLERRADVIRPGDSVTALRELKAWVDAHPKDRAGRQRIGAAVAERAKEAEGKGQRETALGLYEQALALRGEPQAEWSARIAALRKSVANDYYTDGVRLMRTDLDGAVVALEKAVKLDPRNANAANRLREAKAARDKLSRMPAK